MIIVNWCWSHKLQIYSGTLPTYHYRTVYGANCRCRNYIPYVHHSLTTSDNRLASIREKWWAKLRTCWASNPMDRPPVWDMKHMLYFPASLDDNRNEMHGYTLGTDDDDSHGSCKDNEYVHLSFFMTIYKLQVLTHNSRILAAFGLSNLRMSPTALWPMMMMRAIRARMGTTSSLLCWPCNNNINQLVSKLTSDLKCNNVHMPMHEWYKQILSGALNVDKYMSRRYREIN